MEIDAEDPSSAWSDADRDRLAEVSRWARAQPEVRTTVGPVFDAGRARLSVRTADMGGSAFGQLRQRVREELDQALEGSEIRAVLTGTPAVAYRGINRITDDLRRSLVLVFLVVTALLGLLLRSPRLAAISVLPNLFPLVLAYGAVGWTIETLDPLATVILTVALGIAIDDTIHISARYASERAAGRSRDEAIVTTMTATGRAVTVTSITLAAGLAVNLASSFPPLQMLGSLGAAAILLALVADLALLPALLSLFGRRDG